MRACLTPLLVGTVSASAGTPDRAGCGGVAIMPGVRPHLLPGFNTTSIRNPSGVLSQCCSLCNAAGTDRCAAFFTGPEHELCVFFPNGSFVSTVLSPGHTSGFRGAAPPSPPSPPPKCSGGSLDQRLVVLSQAEADVHDAKCLDGSPPAMYYAPASDPAHANDWVIYFKGGGWCFNEEGCVRRAQYDVLGGTTKLPHRLADVWDRSSGPLHPNRTLNPTFSGFHRVLLWYCDGASFGGSVSHPVVNVTANGTRASVYFRGQQVLNALLAKLKGPGYSMDRAENVLVTGCSAGGMATYLQADKVCASVQHPGLRRCRAAPLSGFFLDHPTTQGDPITHKRYAYIAAMQNMTGGVNQACVAARGIEGCVTPQENYAFVQTPIFVMNSMLDAYQMSNILQVGCTFPHCNATQVVEMAAYQVSFFRTISGIATLKKEGNGAFLDNCVVHCGEQDCAGFNGFAVAGPSGNAVLMEVALAKWWMSSTEPAAEHMYAESCTLTGPVHCNPTCGQDMRLS